MSASLVAAPAREVDATLKEWVKQHRVTWELASWQEWVEHQATTVAFELRLFGRAESGTLAGNARLETQTVLERLRAIAFAALPQEQSHTRCEVELDASLHLRPESQWAPEVQVAVHIVHRGDYLRPLDEDQKRCAQDIQRALRALGVQPRSWSDGRKAP